MKSLFLPKRTTYMIILLGILTLLFTSSFVWFANDQVIAPPMLRVQDLLWRLIVCGCF